LKFNAGEERFLEENEVGRFATMTKDGFPHVVPVSYIYHCGAFWIATDYQTRKYRNLRSYKKIGLVVDAGYDSNHGMLIQGKAKIYERGREFRKIYAIFNKKFNWVRADPWKEGEAPFIKIQPVRKACWGPGLS